MEDNYLPLRLLLKVPELLLAPSDGSPSFSVQYVKKP